LCLFAVAFADPLRELNDKDCGKVKIPNYRIVGGETAQKGSYPWVASLRFKYAWQTSSRHICGSSIIDDYWILTAAHCLMSSTKPESYIIRVGTHNQTAGTAEPEATEHKVAKLFPHPEVELSSKIANDIALIKLEKPINFNTNYVNRICLPPSSVYPTDGKVLELCGWGDEKDAQGSKIPQLLKRTELTAHTDATCKSKWGGYLWIDGQMVCAEAPATSPCVGDSGGPLMARDDATGQLVQVGVVSFGERSCAGPRPGVFTRNSHFFDWIKKTMAEN
jgi:secreted trypsin-like serine protease